MEIQQVHKFRVFVDFDGTITREDVGANIFLEFGRRPEVDEIELAIREHRITAYEGWMKLFNAAPGLSLPAIEQYARGFDIDTSFKRLLEFCGQKEIPVCILSDGFENYIRLILEREGITGPVLYANSLETIGGIVVPQFPYSDEECNDCANCKRNHILECSHDDDFTVYIGNGSSDTCPAQFCDYIFAKDDLLKYCEKNRITYYPYFSFNDVVNKLEEIVAKRRPKKRHQAVLKRMEVYKLG